MTHNQSRGRHRLRPTILKREAPLVKSTSAGGPVVAPHVQDLLDSPWAGRKFDRELEVCEIARRVLSFCRYRRAPSTRITRSG
jgi:hypothetical protein